MLLYDYIHNGGSHLNVYGSQNEATDAKRAVCASLCTRDDMNDSSVKRITIELNLERPGHKSIIKIDGKTVYNVAEADVTLRADSIPTVTFKLFPKGGVGGCKVIESPLTQLGPVWDFGDW